MIPLFRVFVAPTVLEEVRKVLASGCLTQGPRVDEFEKALEPYIGRAVTLNSCTSALTLALHLAGINEGSAIITTPMTCTATNLPILTAGAFPVWADVNPRTGLIDPDSVRAQARKCERVVNRRPTAIMGVDWGGAPVAVQDLRIHGVDIIEDAAHAFGLRVPREQADFTCYSFQAIKHLTTGDGGALVCRVDDENQRARDLRWFGISRDAPVPEGGSRIDLDFEEPGFKFHMNDLNAAFGLGQLPYIDEVLRRHQSNAQFYNEHLDERFGRPPSPNAYWLYTMLLPEPGSQDRFKKHMASRGIQVSEVHRRNDAYSVFSRMGMFDMELPGVTEFCSKMICIPVHGALTQTERMQIVNACNEFLVK